MMSLGECSKNDISFYKNTDTGKYVMSRHEETSFDTMDFITFVKNTDSAIRNITEQLEVAKKDRAKMEDVYNMALKDREKELNKTKEERKKFEVK